MCKVKSFLISGLLTASVCSASAAQAEEFNLLISDKAYRVTHDGYDYYRENEKVLDIIDKVGGTSTHFEVITPNFALHDPDGVPLGWCEAEEILSSTVALRGSTVGPFNMGVIDTYETDDGRIISFPEPLGPYFVENLFDTYEKREEIYTAILLDAVTEVLTQKLVSEGEIDLLDIVLGSTGVALKTSKTALSAAQKAEEASRVLNAFLQYRKIYGQGMTEETASALFFSELGDLSPIGKRLDSLGTAIEWAALITDAASDINDAVKRNAFMTSAATQMMAHMRVAALLDYLNSAERAQYDPAFIQAVQNVYEGLDEVKDVFISELLDIALSTTIGGVEIYLDDLAKLALKRVLGDSSKLLKISSAGVASVISVGLELFDFNQKITYLIAMTNLHIQVVNLTNEIYYQGLTYGEIQDGEVTPFPSSHKEIIFLNEYLNYSTYKFAKDVFVDDASLAQKLGFRRFFIFGDSAYQDYVNFLTSSVGFGESRVRDNIAFRINHEVIMGLLKREYKYPCASDEDSVVVNASPVAVVSQSAQTVEAGEVVTFDASASYDPEGVDLSSSYSWELFAPNASSAALSSNTGEVVTLRPDVDGAYTVKLTVSDGEVTDSVTSTIGATRVYPNLEVVYIDDRAKIYIEEISFTERCQLITLDSVTVPQGEKWKNLKFAASQGDVTLLVDDGENPTADDNARNCRNNVAQSFDSDKEFDWFDGTQIFEWRKEWEAGDTLRFALFSYDGEERDFSINSEVTVITDLDSDGIPDEEEDAVCLNNENDGFDTDGDGVCNSADAFENDISASVDSDEDGYPDAWNTGYSEVDSTTGLMLDVAPYDPDVCCDLDEDGVSDDADAFPLDMSASVDTDGDGSPDSWNIGKGVDDSTTGLYLDLFVNDPAASLDSDEDGCPDAWNGNLSARDSTTGLTLDIFPSLASECLDTDFDGVGDNTDWAPEDPNETMDSDGDGVGDNGDFLPLDPNRSSNSAPVSSAPNEVTVAEGDELFVPLDVTDPDGDLYGISNLLGLEAFTDYLDQGFLIRPQSGDEGQYVLGAIAEDVYGATTDLFLTVNVASGGEPEPEWEATTDVLNLRFTRPVMNRRTRTMTTQFTVTNESDVAIPLPLRIEIIEPSIEILTSPDGYIFDTFRQADNPYFLIGEEGQVLAPNESTSALPIELALSRARFNYTHRVYVYR